MKNEKKVVLKWFVLIPVIIFLVSSFTSCQKKVEPACTAEIKIAVAVPTNGDFKEFGKDLINAAQMAIDEENAKGGIKGKKLVMVVEDDKGDPKEAVTVATRIEQDKCIIGVMGHLNSGTMLAASPIYGDANIPVVMPVPTNPQITNQGYGCLFRVPITDDKQGAAAYEFIVSKADKSKLVIIHNKATYGKGIAEEFVKTLHKDGMKELLFEGVNSNDQDYRAVIGKIKVAGAKGIFFGGEYADAARFIKQTREQGVEVPIVMGDGCFNTEMAKIAGDAIRNCFVANIAPINAPDARAQKFYDSFKAKYSKIVAYAPLGYVATKILIDAIEKSSELTRAAVVKILKDRNYSYDSILGPFTFATNGDSEGRKIFWHRFNNGEFEAISPYKLIDFAL